MQGQVFRIGLTPEGLDDMGKQLYLLSEPEQQPEDVSPQSIPG